MVALTPEFDAFRARYQAGEAQLVYTRVIADMETPVSLYAKLAADDKNAFILESVTGGENRARYSVIGFRPDLVLRVNGTQAEINRNALYDDGFAPLDLSPLAALDAEIRAAQIPDYPHAVPAIAAGLYGYLAYDMIRLVEPLGAVNPDPIGTPDAVFIRPTITVAIDNAKNEVIIATPVRPRPDIGARAAYEIAQERLVGIIDAMDRPLPLGHAYDEPTENAPEATSNMEKSAFLDMVARAKDHIVRGDIFQVVLSQRWAMPFALPPFTLYRALRRTNPSPYMYFFNLGGFQIVGASPESLVSLRGDIVTIRPIAGTRPRGETPAEDDAFEASLLADKKELAEHLMLLDLGRNDVGRVAKIGSVRPTEEFIIERYSHVMHIVSNVIGQIDPKKTALDALLSGLPAGTLSGAPKVRAMQIIDALEPEKRGIYGGGLGYFAANGDMDLAIVLRTAVLKDRQLYVQAGAGIVYDSDAEAEFAETVHKSKALFAAARAARAFKGTGNR